MPGYAVWFGSLAQLVEQRTFNPLVAGSNPARPTNESNSYSNFQEIGSFRNYFMTPLAMDTGIFGLSGLTLTRSFAGSMIKSMSSIGMAPSNT